MHVAIISTCYIFYMMMDNIQEMVERMGYFWVNTHGKVREQRSVFRVKCMDCLDRTNVVKAAIARAVVQP